MRRFFFLPTVALSLSVGIATAQTDVSSGFVPTTRSESISAPLAGGAVLSQGSYNGLVQIDLEGSGTKDRAATDSYYSVDRRQGTRTATFAPDDGAWLAAGTEDGGPCLDSDNLSAFQVSDRTVFIDRVGWVVPNRRAIPEYSPNGEYSVVIDLQSYDGRLYVGSRDCGTREKTGGILITLTGVRQCVGRECLAP